MVSRRPLLQFSMGARLGGGRPAVQRQAVLHLLLALAVAALHSAAVVGEQPRRLLQTSTGEYCTLGMLGCICTVPPAGNHAQSCTTQAMSTDFRLDQLPC